MAWGDFAVKVGEEVGIVRTGRWGGFLLSRFGTVTKVNGHGHIFVQAEDREYRFTRRGDAYKDDYGPRLMQASQLRSALAMEEQRKERNRLARAHREPGQCYSIQRADLRSQCLAEVRR